VCSFNGSRLARRLLLGLTKGALVLCNTARGGLCTHGDRHFGGLGEHTQSLLQPKGIAFGCEVFAAAKPRGNKIDKPEAGGEREHHATTRTA
jgi:hypothetical protein